ncbi:MAG: hypothetical protein JWM99_2691 [Verrucomicrobiales bacterium]|nr:hypothetical protein [Verrucomicrobiales bacterium]
MNSYPSTNDSPERIEPCACRIHSTVRGSWGFALVSLIGFGLWACAGSWFYKNVGEAGLYAATTAVFFAASGLFLHPLVHGSNSIRRFYKIFIPAFFAYAAIWCAAWFALRFGPGEWLGSFLGSFAFIALTGFGFGNYRGFLKAGLVMFVTHSTGYFLGGMLMHWLAGPEGRALLEGFSKSQISILAKLSWGLLYGLGFGAGIGFAFWNFQAGSPVEPKTTSEENLPESV